MADLPEAADGPEHRAGLEPEPPRSSWCPPAAAALAPQEGCVVSLPGPPAPPHSRETERLLQPQLWAHSCAPDAQGPADVEWGKTLQHPLCPGPLGSAVGGRMDTPSIPEGQTSLGSLLGSGAARTGKRVTVPFRMWGGSNTEGKAVHSYHTEPGQSPQSSLGSAQRQPGTDPRP